MSRVINRAALTACLLLTASVGIHRAGALGDTRTLTMHHMHTGESITITFKKNGQYDEEALKKINWFLRDWRKAESTTMDPAEIDLLWQVYQEIGATQPIEIVCGYRSPSTNEMLRNRSLRSGVARFSQHTLGKAIDFYIPGVNLEKLRETAMRLQGGGVGYYPTSGSPFVHLDVGNVRAWPRMTREQLVKLFPDGRTVHLPTDGKPLGGYELAKADLERQHRDVGEPQKKSFFASLFSRDKDSEEGGDTAAAREDAVTSKRGVTAEASTGKPADNKPAPVLAKTVVASADAPPSIPAPVVQPVPAPQPVSAQVPMPPRRPMYQIAASESPPAFEPRDAGPVRVASLSASDVVSSRGMWDAFAVPQAAKPVPTTNGLDVSSARRGAAPAREATASIGPFPTQDRVPTDVALAYAAPERASAIVTTKGSASVAAKPAELTASMLHTRADERLDDPWLRGLLLAPNVQRSLVATPVGDPDYTRLTAFMTKPRSAVVMTFSSDPHLGITADQFTGSAIVFPATVTFGSQRATTAQR